MKKNSLTRGVLLALLILATGAVRADCHGMVLHAHRGSHSAPENSLHAVTRAFDGGWDGAEIDIQRLRDQSWVLHHDPQLGRTTTLRQYRAADVDSAAWKEVRLRDRSGKVSSEAAPFLADVLQAVEGDADKVLNVEIKEMARGSCGPAQQAVAALAAGRPNGQWFLAAIDRAQLQCARRVDRRGYLAQIVLDPRSLVGQTRFQAASGRLGHTVIDAAWLARLKQDVGAPVGLHLDVATLLANPRLLEQAGAAGIAVFTYALRGDREHAEALRSTAERSKLLPSGAIIDGAPEQFCSSLGAL